MTEVERKLRQSGHFSQVPNGTAVIENTFWQDFLVAEMFGAKAIKDTFSRAYKEWREDIRYLTALYIAVSWKSFDWADKKNQTLCDLYISYKGKIDDFILERGSKPSEYVHFTQDEIRYFLEATD